MLRYLANLSRGRLILWCYFLWYLVILVRYFDPNPYPWLTALGLSVIIGSALLINTTRTGSERIRLDPWPTFRLFLTPFCVSSFAAMAKGHRFILIFPPRWGELLAGALLCAAFCLAAAWARRRCPDKASAPAVDTEAKATETVGP